MTMAEYDALMLGWNEVHAKDGGPVAAPDLDTWKAQRERLMNSPIARGEPKPPVLPKAQRKGKHRNGRRNRQGDRRA